MKMNVLVVYAHPNRESLTHALLKRFTDGLQEGGHDFEVVDLYALEFDPRFEMQDFGQFTGSSQSADVVEQQHKISNADALVLLFPVWWWGYPAILKGWIDRVFSHGFAYGMTESGSPQGLLQHQKVLLISPTMAQESFYQTMGLDDAMEKVDRATFTGICGIQDVEHVFLFQAATDAAARHEHLNLVHRLGREF
jgi:NAD(P)H dehydrogenase (quinone)